MSIKPFDDFRSLLKSLPEADDFSSILVMKKIHSLTTPKGSLQQFNNPSNLRQKQTSLGKLEDILLWYARWRGFDQMINKDVIAALAIFAGSHSLAQDVYITKDTLLNIQAGGSLVNTVCSDNNIILRAYDLALDYPVNDCSKDAAMDERGCAATMAFGLETIAGEVDILAISCIDLTSNYISELSLAKMVLGFDEKNFLDMALTKDELNKYSKILNRYQITKPTIKDEFNLVQQFGTRELAACIGAILAARTQNICVVLEGYTALLAASILKKMQYNSVEHCIIGQLSQTCFDKFLAEYLDLPVLLEFDMVQNLGYGAALATSMIKTTISSLAKMHDFAMSKKLYKNRR